MAGRPKKFTETKIKSLAKEMLKFYKNNEEALFLTDFCVEYELYPQRISDFANANEEFSESLKIVKAKLENRLAYRGLSARNAAMTIMCLKANHNWSDIQKVETSGSQNINISYNTVQTNKD